MKPVARVNEIHSADGETQKLFLAGWCDIIDSQFKCYWLIFIVTSAGIVPRRHLTKTIYLKSRRPMDIPGDKPLMSDVGTLTISLSKL